MNKITYIEAKPEDIAPLLVELEDILVGHKTVNCIVACLTMAILIQNPKLTPEQVSQAVRNVSEVITLHAIQRNPEVTH